MTDEQTKAYNKAYYQSKKAELNAKAAIYKQNNLAKVLEWKSKYMKEYNKIYTEKNRHKYNAKSMKRHAAKKQRTPKWLKPLDFVHIELFYAAAVSLTKELGMEFEVDHIIPLQGKFISGLHVPSNLQVVTAKFNNAKRNKFPLKETTSAN